MTDNSYQKAWKTLQAGFACPLCRMADGGDGFPVDGAYAANVRALDDYRLNLRVLHDVTTPETGLPLFGMDLASPVLAAPMTGPCAAAEGGLNEADFAEALVAGTAAAGLAGCCADGPDDAVFTAGTGALARAGGRGLVFVHPWEDPELYRKMDAAEALGAAAFGLDMDAADLMAPLDGGRRLAPKPPAKLARLVKRCPLPFVVKGVMTPDEARFAVEAGAAGIVVSNHGALAPGHAPGVAEVLPWIAEAVKGRAAILAWGGARTGGDVLKLLALGADAVMIGRPFAIAAMGGGIQGVQELAGQISRELVRAMLATGTVRAGSTSRSVLYVKR